MKLLIVLSLTDEMMIVLLDVVCADSNIYHVMRSGLFWTCRTKDGVLTYLHKTIKSIGLQENQRSHIHL